MRSFLKITLLVFAGLALQGCALLRLLGFPVGDDVPYNPKDKSGDVAVRRNIQFADIPVPMGFYLRRDKTSSFQGNYFRFGTFLYEGAWTFRRTSQFYRSQMPVSGWEYVETREDGEDDVQIYRKDKEYCHVRISSRIENIRTTVRVFNDMAKDVVMARK